MRRTRLITLTALALTGPGAVAAAAVVPVVWVQAGHEGPREPGYRDQTGAGGGPFGAEVAFNVRVADAVERRLDAAGVDARRTPGLVRPWGSRGATFISIHFDSPGGQAAVGHAITGAGENWYHGEGGGNPSPVPYADSARHRAATTVPAAVERRSRALAVRVASALSVARSRVGGAGSGFGGVVARDGNVRMMRFYGYYRTRAQARVLVECGAAGADDVFLSRTDRIASALAGAILADLRARGLR